MTNITRNEFHYDGPLQQQNNNNNNKKQANNKQTNKQTKKHESFTGNSGRLTRKETWSLTSTETIRLIRVLSIIDPVKAALAISSPTCRRPAWQKYLRALRVLTLKHWAFRDQIFGDLPHNPILTCYTSFCFFKFCF